MPVIKKGSDYMQAVTYTGNGSTQTINVGFQPDLVWIKSRSAATDHKLVDSVRGATLALSSNTTGAEVTDSTGITAFTSTGFTLGANSTYNTNAATYVAWCWKKGATPGFDIVTYTGDGNTSKNVSHSLGVKPSLMIVKNRAAAWDWRVYHATLGATKYLNLDTTDAVLTNSVIWNNTEPTSSVFTVGSNGGVNANGQSLVAYLFAEIPSFSKFGSYTGNGSANGPFVYCGFRPKYVMIKVASGATNDWCLYDTSRSQYNITNAVVAANSSQAESAFASGYNIDTVSNGFKVRDTTTAVNGSGNTLIYAAFAENPFKYSLAR